MAVTSYQGKGLNISSKNGNMEIQYKVTNYTNVDCGLMVGTMMEMVPPMYTTAATLLKSNTCEIPRNMKQITSAATGRGENRAKTATKAISKSIEKIAACLQKRTVAKNRATLPKPRTKKTGYKSRKDDRTLTQKAQIICTDDDNDLRSLLLVGMKKKSAKPPTNRHTSKLRY